MLTSPSARMVIRWECAGCGHINYFDFTMTSKTEAQLKEILEDVEVPGGEARPEDFILMPNKVFCAKCEEQNALPDGFGE